MPATRAAAIVVSMKFVMFEPDVAMIDEDGL